MNPLARHRGWSILGVNPNMDTELVGMNIYKCQRKLRVHEGTRGSDLYPNDSKIKWRNFCQKKLDWHMNNQDHEKEDGNEWPINSDGCNGYLGLSDSFKIWTNNSDTEYSCRPQMRTCPNLWKVWWSYLMLVDEMLVYVNIKVLMWKVQILIRLVFEWSHQMWTINIL